MIRTIEPKVDLAGLIADAIEEGREVHVVEATETKQGHARGFAEALDFPAGSGATSMPLPTASTICRARDPAPGNSSSTTWRHFGQPTTRHTQVCTWCSPTSPLRHPSIQVTLLAR